MSSLNMHDFSVRTLNLSQVKRTSFASKTNYAACRTYAVGMRQNSEKLKKFTLPVASIASKSISYTQRGHKQSLVSFISLALSMSLQSCCFICFNLFMCLFCQTCRACLFVKIVRFRSEILKPRWQRKSVSFSMEPRKSSKNSVNTLRTLVIITQIKYALVYTRISSKSGQVAIDMNRTKRVKLSEWLTTSDVFTLRWFMVSTLLCLLFYTILLKRLISAKLIWHMQNGIR